MKSALRMTARRKARSVLRMTLAPGQAHHMPQLVVIKRVVIVGARALLWTSATRSRRMAMAMPKSIHPLPTVLEARPSRRLLERASRTKVCKAMILATEAYDAFRKSGADCALHFGNAATTTNRRFTARVEFLLFLRSSRYHIAFCDFAGCVLCDHGLMNGALCNER